ncbi:hypothetical protein [Spongiactinospora sp. TRM90649]|uniref:hypothetical protein n=1 Tax=Spongiactinospora sp. TRM90649 TaxID=3031114 RepID=UPI003211C02D
MLWIENMIQMPCIHFMSNREVSSGARHTGGRDDRPDIWELDIGDIAVIGRDLTFTYGDRLPADVRVAAGERVVITPRRTLIAAKPDIPDA